LCAQNKTPVNFEANPGPKAKRRPGIRLGDKEIGRLIRPAEGSEGKQAKVIKITAKVVRPPKGMEMTVHPPGIRG